MSILTHDQKVNLYMWCLDQGVNLDYGKLSLCDLRNYYYSNLKSTRKFQVHCDDPKYPWSMIYDDMRVAVIKFLEIKDRVKRVK